MFKHLCDVRFYPFYDSLRVTKLTQCFFVNRISFENIKIMGRRKVPPLYRAPFPLYTVKIDPKTGFVITAGGGGASKTGIKNGVVSIIITLQTM